MLELLTPKLKGSWKTTVLGVVLMVLAVCTQVKNVVDNDPATTFDWKVLVAGVTAGLGLMHARDNGVSSEQAGAK